MHAILSCIYIATWTAMFLHYSYIYVRSLVIAGQGITISLGIGHDLADTCIYTL